MEGAAGVGEARGGGVAAEAAFDGEIVGGFALEALREGEEHKGKKNLWGSRGTSEGITGNHQMVRGDSDQGRTMVDMPKGWVRKERMTLTKTASRCIEVTVRPSGGGMNQMERRRTIDGTRRTMLYDDQ